MYPEGQLADVADMADADTLTLLAEVTTLSAIWSLWQYVSSKLLAGKPIPKAYLNFT